MHEGWALTCCVFTRDQQSVWYLLVILANQLALSYPIMVLGAPQLVISECWQENIGLCLVCVFSFVFEIQDTLTLIAGWDIHCCGTEDFVIRTITENAVINIM